MKTMEKIKWKLYLRWSVTKYRIKTAKLKRRIRLVKMKTAVLKMIAKCQGKELLLSDTK